MDQPFELTWISFPATWQYPRVTSDLASGFVGQQCMKFPFSLIAPCRGAPRSSEIEADRRDRQSYCTVGGQMLSMLESEAVR